MQQFISISADVKKALGKKPLAKFEAMSPSHRREWIKAIEEAKKSETRKRRIETLVAKMKVND